MGGREDSDCRLVEGSFCLEAALVLHCSQRLARQIAQALNL